MKVSFVPHFDFFSPPRRVLHGESIYDIADLDQARGAFQLRFASDSIVNENAAVLINIVELLDFLYRTADTIHSECLFLDMTPCLFSQPVDQGIRFSWPDPSRVDLLEEDILEVCTLTDFHRVLSEAETAAETVFANVSPDLRKYLAALARTR